MNQCLKDRSLLLLYEGEGTSTQRSHLAECKDCATRYQRLGRDLDAIERVLREEPPSEIVRYRPQPFTLRWLPTAAAVAMVLALVWGSVQMWSPSPPPIKETSNEEIWYILEEVSADLFLLDEAIAEEPWSLDADYDLPVALLEEWPCEWVDTSSISAGGYFGETVGDIGLDAIPFLCGG